MRHVFHVPRLGSFRISMYLIPFNYRISLSSLKVFFFLNHAYMMLIIIGGMRDNIHSFQTQAIYKNQNIIELGTE